MSLMDMLETLDRRRFTFRVVLPGGGELSQRLTAIQVPVERCAALCRLYRSGGLVKLAGQVGNIGRGNLALNRLVRRYEPHLVHANSTTAALYALAVPWPRIQPVIWHLRDLSAPHWVSRWLAHRCVRIVVPSRACRDLVRTVADPAKIVLIPNGIKLEQPAADASRLRREMAVGAGPIVVVVGQLARWKGHALAIEAARWIRDLNPAVRFLVIGDDRFGDHPGVLDDLRQQVRKLGLEEAVRLLGYRTDVPSILGAADLLLHPAYPEPFGRVVVEAMAAGRPVVAFAGDHGPAEIVQDGVDGVLVTPRTPEALAAAVSRLLADRELREKLGAAAKERAAALYDRTLMAQRVAALYGSLISESATYGEGALA